MTTSALGLIIERAIPPDVIYGLVTGAYKLHGGVIRHAAGSEMGGQIVRHLIPVVEQSLGTSLAPISGILEAINTYKLHEITKDVGAIQDVTEQILQVATSTMSISGLNLAVTAVGFAVISQKLNVLEDQLSRIQQDVQAIRILLELKERSELKAALKDLRDISQVSNTEHRHKMLFNSKNILAPVSLKYRELLAEADTIETAMAYEEYFSLTSLAHARCVAELDMLQISRRDLQDTKDFWQIQSRRIVNNLLFGDDPERFLFSDFAKTIPLSELVSWLDFAYGEEKGYNWLDELRGQTKPWYPIESEDKKDDESKWGFSRLGRVINRSSGEAPLFSLASDNEKVIPALRKLVARNNIMEGYGAQYQLLEERNMTPSAFEANIKALPETDAVDGFFILKPAEIETNS